MLRLELPFAGDITTYAVVQPFGPTALAFELPYNGYAHFHTGDDFGLPMMTPVLAAADGTVILAGWAESFGWSGFGNMVLVDHGSGIRTLYGHLAQIGVTAGQQIRAHAGLGLSGTTGNSTGPHLHFGVEQDGVWVDPWPLLTAPPPPPPPPPPPVEGPRYRLTTAMHFRPLPATDALPQGPLLPVGTVVIKTYNPPKGQPTETTHWVWCRTGGDVRGYLLKSNMVEVPA